MRPVPKFRFLILRNSPGAFHAPILKLPMEMSRRLGQDHSALTASVAIPKKVLVAIATAAVEMGRRSGHIGGEIGVVGHLTDNFVGESESVDVSQVGDNEMSFVDQILTAVSTVETAWSCTGSVFHCVCVCCIEGAVACCVCVLRYKLKKKNSAI